MELLEDLPGIFVKDFDFGLGFRAIYRPIIDAIEEITGHTDVLITGDEFEPTDFARASFHVTSSELSRITRAINRVMADITKHGQTVARSLAEEVISYKADHPISGLGSEFWKSIDVNAAFDSRGPTSKETQKAFDLLSRHMAAAVRVQPDRAASFVEDMEQVRLDTLISDFEDLLRKKPSEEQDWQSFLDRNRILLNLAFGYPVITVRGQASVGGRRLDGKGDSIADFLVRNSMTNNCAIVEIKTPKAKLLNARPTRTGVYTPAGDLVGAVNQALDQRYKFDREIAQIKENSGDYDLASYSVHCCLLIGMMPSGDEQQKSFELYRQNSKDVEIVTFDELLEKVRQIREFLRNGTQPTP